MKNIKAYIAECLGTFVLVFFACGVAAWTGGDPVPTAMAFGLVIVAMAYTVGRLSGCHINPAVSLACYLTKRMSAKDLGFYVLAQILGGFAGAALLFGIAKMGNLQLAGDACNSVVGANFDSASFGNYLGAILMETVLTFVFVYVILNVTDGKNEGVGKKAGVLIGFTLTLVHLLGIGFTGTSVNPARSLATALGSLIFNESAEALKVVWVFLLAPLIGAGIAALVYNVLHKEEK